MRREVQEDKNKKKKGKNREEKGGAQNLFEQQA